MSNLVPKLRFERKRGISEHYRRYNFDPNKQEIFQASAHGGSIVVKDVKQARRLFLVRNFGSFIGQRMNFTNSSCFPSSEESEEASKITGKQWMSSCSQCRWLFLSHIEALYLFADVGVLTIGGYETPELFYKETFSRLGWEFARKFAVYRHFRRLGWVVRDGIPFGCDYLLYKDSVEVHHSSAGVRIVAEDDKLDDALLIGLKRELSNCKKVLLLASIEESNKDGLDFSELKSLDRIKPEVVMFTGWNWKRSRTFDLDRNRQEEFYESGSDE